MDNRKFLVIQTKGMDTERLQKRLDRLTEKHTGLKVESTIGTRLIVSYEQKESESGPDLLTTEELINGLNKLNRLMNKKGMSGSLKMGM